MTSRDLSRPRHAAPAAEHQLDGRVPRPPNAFILYRKDTQPRLVLEYKGKGRSSRDFSSMVGQMWQNESPVIKAYYQSMAKDRLAEHRRLYPDYCYRPKKDTTSAKPKTKSKPPTTTACPYPTPTKPKRSRTNRRFTNRDSDSDSDFECSDSSAFNSAYSSRAPSPSASPAERFLNPLIVSSSNAQIQTLAYDPKFAMDAEPAVETDGWISEFSTHSALSSREGSIASFHQGFDNLQIREVAASIQDDDVHLLDKLLGLQQEPASFSAPCPTTMMESSTPLTFGSALNASQFFIPSQMPSQMSHFQESSFPWDSSLPEFSAHASALVAASTAQASAPHAPNFQNSTLLDSFLRASTDQTAQVQPLTFQSTIHHQETQQITQELDSKISPPATPVVEPFQFVVPSQNRVPSSGPKRSSSLRLDTTSTQAMTTPHHQQQQQQQQQQQGPKSGIWLTSAKILSPLTGVCAFFSDDYNMATTPRAETSSSSTSKQGMTFPSGSGGLLSATTPRAIAYGSRVFDFFGAAMSPSRTEVSDVKPWFN
ncbi:hypothetical protein CcCBS67573_g02045 [Chytriomyces confervae]|uniref:HMG box domain-containing protein n=1 Tax=Chytriomyces confervae TaxID=246404 RepID=A0A507FKC8_9FUNG|nr:hypothetical protein CcCBS67573_g02045 [Chytriomyces confervae]